MNSPLVLSLLLGGCGAKKVNSIPQTNTLVPSAGVHLRNSFDTDPSSYLGRFVPDAAEDIDESSAMQMSCSQHISWQFIDGGGVRYNEILSVSTEVGARMGVPVIASGSASASADNVVRVNYTLTGKMIANIDDPDAFADCCRTQPDQCARRYIGEFIQGTGSVYHEAARDVGGEGEGMDPSSGINGGVDFSHGTSWQRAVEFDNPVYFAFKVTETPYSQQAVQAVPSPATAPDIVTAPPVAQCDSWMDEMPGKPGGTYYLGMSKQARSEQGARNRALTNARLQAASSGQIALPAGIDADTASTMLPGVAAEDWCIETISTDKGDRFIARVLAFQPHPTPAQLAALASAAATPEPTALPVTPTAIPAARAPAAATTGMVPDPMKRTARVMSSDNFSALIGSLNSVSFSSDKLNLIQTAAASNHFTVRQVATILETLSFSSDQLKALSALHPMIVDPQNAAQLGAVFSFSSDLEEAMKLFQ